MIRYFPLPYPDELLYSVIGRFLKHIGSNSVFDILTSIFGQFRTVIMDLPIGLRGLLNNTLLGRYFSEEEIIHNHTLFPFYTGFIGAEERGRLSNFMLEDGPTQRWNKIAYFTKICHSRRLRFCPLCIKDDISKFGEPYWHRIHQVPGVQICSIHEVSLSETCPSCGSAYEIEQFKYHALDSRCTCGISLADASAPKEEISAQNLRYAKSVEVLLKDSKLFEAQAARDIYIAKLKYSGLANINGIVQTGKLSQEIEVYYGQAFLEKIESVPIKQCDRNWVYNLFRDCRANQRTHPIRHLLMINFLFSSMQEFLHSKPEFKPFGYGPWPCLNPAANHYAKPMIANYVLSKGTSMPVLGVFECECGFKYTRGGPQNNVEGQLKPSRILNYGPIWETKVHEMHFKHGYNLNKIAAELLTNTRSIKRCLEKFKVADSPRFLELAPLSNSDAQRQGYRNVMQQLIKNNPGITRTMARKIENTTYRWLYQFDRAWLGEMLTEIPRSKPRAAIDWNERDLEICFHLLQAANEIKEQPGPPLRVLKDGLEKILRTRTNSFAFLHKRLPKSIKLVDSLLESEEEYAQRCIVWAMAEIASCGEEITESRIRKMVGLRGKITVQLMRDVFNSMTKTGKD